MRVARGGSRSLSPTTRGCIMPLSAESARYEHKLGPVAVKLASGASCQRRWPGVWRSRMRDMLPNGAVNLGVGGPWPSL